MTPGAPTYAVCDDTAETRELEELSEAAEPEHTFAPAVYEKGLEREAGELLQAIHAELRVSLLLVEDGGKDYYRRLHEHARSEALKGHRAWIGKMWPKLRSVFADPKTLRPEKIRPRLVLVQTQRDRDIFRLAQLTWSLPFSGGYGRRLNYLIWDVAHDSLIGVLGLQSPPLVLPARDRVYPMPYADKPKLVNQTMDGYVVGAVAPYADLLGGKLAVLAAASSDVRHDYQRRYRGRETRIEKRVLPASLVAVTSLSAYGRSSMYNRVSAGTCNGRVVWATESLGGCEGWGTLHFSPTLYEEMKAFHVQLVPEMALYGFGIGPKIKQQVVKRVLRMLHLQETFVRHNVKREVFVISHVANLKAYLAGEDRKPQYIDRRFSELAHHWMSRYCIPRSEQRCPLEGGTAVARALGMGPTGLDYAFEPVSYV